MTRRVASLLANICLLAFFGCDSKGGQPSSNLPTTRLSVGSREYELEIAAKDFDRQTGLMRRDSMPADHGMIFIFRDERDEAFWMKNTRIALDIVYVADSGKVMSVHHMDPYKTTDVPSEGKVRFAIELNAGQAADNGIKKGDTVTIPPAIRKINADP